MFPRLSSLRVRFVVLFVLTVGLINVGLGLGGVTLRARALRQRFDVDLQRQSAELAKWMGAGDTYWTQGMFGGLVEHFERGGHLIPGLFAQVRDRRGRVVFTTENLQGTDLPLSEGILSELRTTGVYQGTFRAADLGLPEVERGRVRVRVRVFAREGEAREPYILQVAASEEEIKNQIDFLWTLVWVGTGGSLFASAVAAWLLTDRALGRLNLISRLASELDPQHLDRRVEVDADEHDEISRLGRDVNRMLARLESAFKAQDRFIADASHELRTPIAVMLAEAQVLKASSDPDPRELQRFVDSVEAEMRRLHKMVNSLLSLARIEGVRGRAKAGLAEDDDDGVLTARASLVEAAVEAAQHVSAVGEASRVSIAIRLPEPEDDDEGQAPGDAEVLGDANLLQVMLENLLRNAERFSPPGGRVDVTVTLEADEDGEGQAVVRVRDRGPGIPESHLQTIFERFESVRDADGVRRGTGLGLSIARTIVELHGGTITARNAADAEGGAIFEVRLSLASDTSPPASASSAAAT